MNKYCNKCKTDKPLEAFQFRDKAKGTRRSNCRDCVSKYDKWAYSIGIKTGNSKESKANIAKRNKDFVIDLLSKSNCKDCGNTDLRVLEFDHLTNKKYNIASMLNSFSIETIKNEIEKCDIVCRNCHTIRTYTRSPNYRTLAFMGV